MSTVYRIQSKYNRERGAYAAPTDIMPTPEVVNKMLDKHSDFEGKYALHPTPMNDTGIERSVKSNEYCGFDSAASLLRWFRGFIPELLQTGYEIVKLNVNITAVGEHQVLFKF